MLEGDGDDSGAALRLQRSQTDEVIVTQLPPMSGYGELGESVPIVGVVGVVHLLSGPYILVVAAAEAVGKLLGHDVYRVTDVSILPFAANLSGLPAVRQQDEQLYLSMLRTFLTSRHLYFSYTMDLTNSLQEQSNWTAEHQRSPIWRTADSRFFWNEALVRPLAAISGGCDSFILPIIVGFASIKTFELGGQRCGLALISRKSKLRAGTRYNTRGVSRDGQAANFAETEQILWVEPGAESGRSANVSAYLQTRGSAPVLWSQPVDLHYNPPFHIADELSMEARAAFRAHVEEQRARYGAQVLVSLLDNIGPEAALQRQLRHHVRTNAMKIDIHFSTWGATTQLRLTIGSVHLHRRWGHTTASSELAAVMPSVCLVQGMGQRSLWWTLTFTISAGICSAYWLCGLPIAALHAGQFLDDAGRCTQSIPGLTAYRSFCCRYQNLSILVEQCEAHIRSHGYFEADGVKISTSRQTEAEAAVQEPLRKQSGCFRTNCKDALDRTNVVQSVFAERFLVDRLQSLGLLGAGDGIGSSTQLSTAFMNTWADNADALAMAYVGTPALKTDFTRTGKRTLRGAAMDGWHSFYRYFLGECCSTRTS